MLGGFVSYWQLPLISAATWFGTLLAMMIVWLAKGQPIYPSMSYAQGQTIAYISDIGATGLKPLFIAGSTVSVVIFDLAFISERWLRHKGRLAHNTNWTQKILSICSIVAAIVGAAGLILLTIFDTLHHPHLHRVFLGLFIGGYIVSAIFICAEYQRLGVTFREYKVLRMSFWIKLFFIFAEVALVIAFGVMSYQVKYNTAAILEWTISLVYIFYVLSFVLDFLPAVRTKHSENRFPTIEELRHADHNGPSASGGPVFTEDAAAANAYAEGHPHQHHFSHGVAQPEMQQTGTGGYPTYGQGFAAPADTPRDSYASSSRPIVDNGEPQMYPARAF